jgi:hypothetical protein
MGRRIVNSCMVVLRQWLHRTHHEVKHDFNRVLLLCTVPSVPDPIRVMNLDDHFGQYVLLLRCENCRHVREARPVIFARICGWSAKLQDVRRRLRCSKCGRRQCSVEVMRQMSDHR